MWTVDSAHLIRLVIWRGTAGEELAYKGAVSFPKLYGDGAYLIRLVLWRGTAGEELAYVGALSSDRPLHRAFACAIGFLQVNHKALHAFALMGANAEAQRISHWDEPSGPLASEHEHECCVGCPSTSGGLKMRSAPQRSLDMGIVHPRWVAPS